MSKGLKSAARACLFLARARGAYCTMLRTCMAGVELQTRRQQREGGRAPAAAEELEPKIRSPRPTFHAAWLACCPPPLPPQAHIIIAICTFALLLNKHHDPAPALISTLCQNDHLCCHGCRGAETLPNSISTTPEPLSTAARPDDPFLLTACITNLTFYFCSIYLYVFAHGTTNIPRANDTEQRLLHCRDHYTTETRRLVQTRLTAPP